MNNKFMRLARYTTLSVVLLLYPTCAAAQAIDNAGLGFYLIYGIGYCAYQLQKHSDTAVGFSALNVKNSGDTERTNPIGWQASLQRSGENGLGYVMDFGGQYRKPSGQNSSTFAFEYLFGLQYTHKIAKKATAFSHALFGRATIGHSSGSDNAFMMGYGGGIDLDVNDTLAFRLVQFDWLPSRHNGWETNRFRFGFGVVFKHRQ